MEYHDIISEHFRHEVYHKGQTIYFKGDKAKNFYLIVHGSVTQLELKSGKALL
jgi:CRP-like cAMP-binding protein